MLRMNPREIVERLLSEQDRPSPDDIETRGTPTSKSLKVLLPDKDWRGELPPEYGGHFEGVWVMITYGDEDNGEGVLVNRPIFDPFAGINVGDLVRYKTTDPTCKPVIVERLGAAEREPGRFESVAVVDRLLEQDLPSPEDIETRPPEEPKKPRNIHGEILPMRDFPIGSRVRLRDSDLDGTILRRVHYNDPEYVGLATRYFDDYNVRPEETIGFSPLDIFYVVDIDGREELSWRSELMLEEGVEGLVTGLLEQDLPSPEDMEVGELDVKLLQELEEMYPGNPNPFSLVGSGEGTDDDPMDVPNIRAATILLFGAVKKAAEEIAIVANRYDVGIGDTSTDEEITSVLYDLIHFT